MIVQVCSITCHVMVKSWKAKVVLSPSTHSQPARKGRLPGDLGYLANLASCHYRLGVRTDVCEVEHAHISETLLTRLSEA